MMWAGYLGALVLWYACVTWLPLESFRRLPDPVTVIREWVSPTPTYGVSLFTEAYYKHILYSVYRATAAFLLATVLGGDTGRALAVAADNVFQTQAIPDPEALSRTLLGAL